MQGVEGSSVNVFFAVDVLVGPFGILIRASMVTIAPIVEECMYKIRNATVLIITARDASLGGQKTPPTSSYTHPPPTPPQPSPQSSNTEHCCTR